MMSDTKYEGVKSKVSVAIRVRPFIERERVVNETEKWIVSKHDLMLKDPDGKTGGWVYDHVFGKTTRTSDIYDEVVAPIVDKAFDGFNGTILCYGQTSSGKTHTLYGSDMDKGIISLFSEHLFRQKQADEGRKMYIVKVGVIEIYNEKLTDLLNSDNTIEIQERDGNFVPTGFEELTVTSSNELIEIAEEAQQRRKTGETAMNKSSSRSHTALRVTISMADLSDGENIHNFTLPGVGNPALTTSVLHFVDLAGSEKQSQTGAEGERLREAININKSLSNLSHVINQLSGLAEINDKSLCRASTEPRKGPISRFVNYRDSKLTRLLKSTLSGEAYISLICNVTVANVPETRSTLEFASRAKNIKVQPKQNFSASNEFEKKVLELQKLLETRDKEMDRLKRQLENFSKILPRNQTPFPFLQPSETHELRRYSLCIPSQSSTIGRKTFGGMSAQDVFKKPLHPRLSDEDDFMSAEKATMHFKQLTSERKIESVSKWRNQEVQTEAQGLVTPKRRKTDMSDPETPTSSLLATRSILRAALESDQSEWAERLAFLEEENACLRSQDVELNRLREEVERLKIDNEELVAEKTELEKDVLRQMQASKKSLKMLVTELEATKGNESGQKESEQRERILSLEEEIKTLQSHQSESVTLKTELTAANNRIQELISCKLESDKQISSLEEEIRALQPLQSERITLKTELTAANNKIQELISGYLESDKQISSLKEENKALLPLQSESITLKTELTAANNKIQELISDKLESDKQISLLKEETKALSPLQSEYPTLKTELTTANNKIEELISGKLESDKLISSLKEENKALSLLQSENITLKTELTTANNKNQELISGKLESDKLISLLKEETKELSPLQSEYTTLKTELTAANDKIQQLISDKLESDKQVSLLKEENEALSPLLSENLTLNTELTAASNKIQELISDKLESDKLISSLKEETKALSPLHSESITLKTELTAANNKIQELTSGKLESDKLISSLKEENKALSLLQSENITLKTELTSEKNKIQEIISDKLESDKQISLLKEETKALSPFQSENITLKTELTAANNKIQELTSGKLESDKLISSLKEENKALSLLQSENITLKTELTTEKNKIQEIISDKLESDKQISLLKEEIEALSPLQSENITLKTELTAANNKIQELISCKSESNKLILSLKEEIKALSPLQSEYTTLKTKLTAANNKIQELISDKLESDKLIASLKEETKALSPLQSENITLKTDLTSAKNKIQQLISGNLEGDKQISLLKEEIKALSPLQSENITLKTELTTANKRIRQFISEKNDLESELLRKEESLKDLSNRSIKTVPLKVNRGTDCEIIKEDDVKYWKEESRKYRDYARLLHGKNKKFEEKINSMPDKDARITELEAEVARKEEDVKSLQAIILDVPEPKLLVNEEVQCTLLTDPKPSTKSTDSGFSKYYPLKPLPTTKPGFRPPSFLVPMQTKKLLKPNQSENQNSSTQSSSGADSANIRDKDTN